MNANHDVIDDLQKALSMELAAIHQYMLHAHVLEDWSITALAAKMREEMSEEQGHADQFTRRIMFLKGNPVMQSAKTPLCQRRSDIAAAGRSKSASGMCKQQGPLEGALLLAARHS